MILLASITLALSACGNDCFTSCFPGDGGSDEAAKPIVYLYPETTQAITVELLDAERLTHTYPKYESAWEVTAQPNGDLTELKTGRSFYGLYYECVTVSEFNMQEGFVVEGKTSSLF